MRKECILRKLLPTLRKRGSWAATLVTQPADQPLLIIPLDVLRRQGNPTAGNP